MRPDVCLLPSPCLDLRPFRPGYSIDRLESKLPSPRSPENLQLLVS